MTVPIAAWPEHLFPATTAEWSLDGRTLRGGLNLAGWGQVGAFGGGGFWTLRLSGIALLEIAQVKAARALAAILDGGATPILVGPCESWYAPRPAGAPASMEVPHSDDALFSDGTGYLGSYCEVALAADATLRATTLDLDLVVSGPLVGGEAFSIDHETQGRRRYQVGRVLSVAGSVATVTVRPPLREAVSAGAPCDFDNPSCVMRLADPSALRVPVDLGKFGNLDVTFVEDFS